MIINTLVNKVHSAATKIQLWWLKCKYKGKDPYDKGKDIDMDDEKDKEAKGKGEKVSGKDDPPDEPDDPDDHDEEEEDEEEEFDFRIIDMAYAAVRELVTFVSISDHKKVALEVLTTATQYSLCLCLS